MMTAPTRGWSKDAQMTCKVDQAEIAMVQAECQYRTQVLTVESLHEAAVNCPDEGFSDLLSQEHSILNRLHKRMTRAQDNFYRLASRTRITA